MSGLNLAQNSNEIAHPTRGYHPVSSIHLFRHPFYSHEHHNPNRNAVRDAENDFLNVARKEIFPLKKMFVTSGQGLDEALPMKARSCRLGFSLFHIPFRSSPNRF